MGLMDVREARDGYYTHSGKASDVARQLGLAGIALIWIFRTGADSSSYAIPSELLLPSIFIVATLAADFLQYASAALAWGLYSRWKEQRPEIRDDPKTRFEAPPKLNWPGNAFFGIKLVSITIAYALLLVHLFKQFA